MSDTALTRPLRREQLQARLEALKREDRAGEARLRELEQELTNLRQTVLRISGAIQVLEELLSEDNPAETAIERT
jgi:chromosome segregation ATPase